MRRIVWQSISTVCLLVTTAIADNKYFHEPAEDDLHRHYDTRFFHTLVSDEERQISLTALIRAYLLLFNNLNLQTWLAHGTLLGWYWNGSVLPWDWDLDAQVTNATLHILATKHNGTYHEYHSPALNVTRRYFLDINAWSWERVLGNGDNIIDARFIDTSNGMFLDITGLTANDPENADVIECKHEHRYNTSDIFPVRETIFEGVRAWVPYEYARVLVEEYKAAALLTTEFHNYTFDHVSGTWQKATSSKEGQRWF